MKKKAQKIELDLIWDTSFFNFNEIPDKVCSLLCSIQFMHLKVFWLCFLRVILIIYSVGVSFSVKKSEKKQQFIINSINILDMKQIQLYQA